MPVCKKLKHGTYSNLRSSFLVFQVDILHMPSCVSWTLCPFLDVQVFSDLKNSGLPLSTVAYNAALVACKNGKQCDQALELYQEMHGSKVAVPDEVSYNVVVETCLASGQPNKAADVERYIIDQSGNNQNSDPGQS